MKKLITLFASLIILISVEAQQAKKFKDIVGRWEIAGEQNAGASLEIVDSTTMLLTYMGETKKISDIKIDFTKSPAWLDFTASDTSNTAQKIKSIIEIGDNVIKWQLFVDEERSAHFTKNKGEILYLRKNNSRSTITAKNE